MTTDTAPPQAPAEPVAAPRPAHEAAAPPAAAPAAAAPAAAAAATPPAEPPRPASRPVSRQPFEAALVTRILALVAVGALGFVGYLLLLSPVQQNSAQDVLYSQLRGPIAEAIPPYAGAAESADGTITRNVPAIYDDGEDVLIPAGAPIAVLEIPSIDLRQVIVEGTSSGDLLAGPGHRRDTVLPGQRGVSLVYGRATTFGGPFGRLPDLDRGDRFTVVTFQGRFEYEVEGLRRDGDPLPDIAPILTNGSRVTLVTAEGGNPLQPDRTLFVDAILRGDPQPAAERPALIPPDERAMETDGAALLNLVLWLQALAVVTALLAWARIRWGRWESHLVGLPVLLAIVWNVFEALARSLPNLT